MKRIVECVPNFSEGRRPEVIAAIKNALTRPGVTLLDQHSDADHNRTVITLVGEPQAIEQAAFAGIAQAAELIDLNVQRGEHPRIGATDVVPFVPVAGVTMDECVVIARRLGERVGRELNIPVYLYEAAATRPDRVNLENIRRGEYEQLKKEIGTHPDRAPDFGPARVGPAGATVIGARPFLIAFNAYLNTPDVNVAKQIAKAIRYSSGGLRYVKALGLEVDGKAQVSMNLTDFHKTPIARVVEMVRREAERYGCTIVKTELVGLIPQAALIDAAQWYLQIDGLQPDQILENRLSESLAQASEPAPGLTPSAFLDATAAGTATPGGGAVAALAGALAAALTAMVARLTLGKKKYAEYEAEMTHIVSRAEELRARLTSAIEADSAAFDAVMAALKLPKGTPAEQDARQRELQVATQHAIEVPLSVAHACAEALQLLQQVAAHGNVNAMSDAASGAYLARAALEAAGMNVRVNAAGLDDADRARRQVEEFNALRAHAAELAERILADVERRAGLK
ncbi:MAG TPA: glutamate formimidoyltransferase [Anaerolineae bacterium]|nr:glutamate formimidoyltransferase [Anaerolineae bacterium]